jgi:diaminohydroxyphosphoribosylaminopyrimidine deaminase / 5-amino-6-(5-phosphoribosylamino)uracil reductase
MNRYARVGTSGTESGLAPRESKVERGSLDRGSGEWAEPGARVALLGAHEAWRMLRAVVEQGLAAAGQQSGEISVEWRDDAPPLVTPGRRPDATLVLAPDGSWEACQPLLDSGRHLLELYAPLCRARSARFVVAHLGQSLDGRIGSLSGEPENITGSEDVAHNHRMRALFDAVLVGAGTVYHDDPLLTVRRAEGRHPYRVVLDPNRTLSSEYRIFTDGAAPTLLLCREELRGERPVHGQAEVVGLPACTPQEIVDALCERGLPRLFIEGGGVTVSRFLAARCLDRLQITISPMIMGQGRPSLLLDQALRLRPRTRRFDLADDVMFECFLDER